MHTSKSAAASRKGASYNAHSDDTDKAVLCLQLRDMGEWQAVRTICVCAFGFA